VGVEFKDTESGRPTSIARTAALLLPVQVLSRAGEAALPILLATWFGRSEGTDALFLFAVYFAFAGSMITGAFQDSVLVPIIASVRVRDAHGLQPVVSSLLGHVLAAGSALATLLGAIGLAWTTTRPALFPTAAALCLSFSVHLIAVAVRALLVALLNAHAHYFAHPLSSGSGFAIAIGFMAGARARLGLVAVPAGLLLGEMVAIALLASVLRVATGLRLRPSLARPGPVLRFFRLAFSDVAGATITRVNPVIDQLVAAFAGTVGGGTVLRFAMDVGAIPTTLLQATVLPVLLSRLSEEAVAAAPRAFAGTVRSTLARTSAALAVLTGVLAVSGAPLLRVLFLHGRMDEGGVRAMAQVLPWAAVGSIPFGALLVLARAHVALENTRLMLPLGVLNASLNLTFDLILVRVAGLSGIALATSLVHAVIAVVFWRALRRKLEVS
jgi:putative peptidoglycan lipid II flippase